MLQTRGPAQPLAATQSPERLMAGLPAARGLQAPPHCHLPDGYQPKSRRSKMIQHEARPWHAGGGDLYAGQERYGVSGCAWLKSSSTRWHMVVASGEVEHQRASALPAPLHLNDCMRTQAAAAGTVWVAVCAVRMSERGQCLSDTQAPVWAEHGSSTTHKYITLRTAPWGIEMCLLPTVLLQGRTQRFPEPGRCHPRCCGALELRPEGPTSSRVSANLQLTGGTPGGRGEGDSTSQACSKQCHCNASKQTCSTRQTLKTRGNSPRRCKRTTKAQTVKHPTD